MIVQGSTGQARTVLVSRETNEPTNLWGRLEHRLGIVTGQGLGVDLELSTLVPSCYRHTGTENVGVVHFLVYLQFHALPETYLLPKRIMLTAE